MHEDRMKLLIAAIIVVYAAVVFLGPVYRYGDDLRYLSAAKTMAETGEIAPVRETVANTVFDGPPLFTWFVAAFYILAGGNVSAWAMMSKIFVMLVSVLSVLLVRELAVRAGLSQKGRLVAVALFAFYPPVLFTATSVMQDMLLVLLTLVSFMVLKRENLSSFLKAGVFMGLMLLLKVTAPLAVVCVLLAAIIRFGPSKRNFLLCLAALLVASAIWAPWAMRNVSLFGNPIYHHSADETYALYPGAGTLEKIVYVYLSLWGIPPASSITARIPFIGESFAVMSQIALALFFTPLLAIGLKDINERQNRHYAPFVLLGLFFTLVYLSAFVHWTDPRHFIFAMPFFAVIVGRWAETSKNRFALPYVALCLAILLSGAIFIEYRIAENKSDLLGSIQATKDENPGKGLAFCNTDSELAMAANLFKGENVSMTSAFPYCEPIQLKEVRYCVAGKTLFFFNIATSSSNC